ncbi:MAG TPA: universal stress protein [Gammaproteobacteria bacterium]|nr:universal stress protein [Gammaproteobacteria bacterium]
MSAAKASSQKTIMVVVDPLTEEDQPVLHRAAWLAEKTGAALELFAADYDADIDSGRITTAWIPEPGAREQLLLRHRRRLENFASALRGRGLKVSVDVIWDYPLDEAIVRRVAAKQPWLVAKDTQHHTLIQRTLFSNTDWNLIRDCPVPLLLVKRREIAAAPTVLAAIDPVHEHDKPARLDDAIYEFGAELCAKTGGTLHLVHAVETPLGVQLPANVHAVVAAQHREAMETFLLEHPVPGPNVHVLEGLAHQCLLSAAESQKADVLVMGAVVRRGLKKVLIGSTAARVLDRLPCDLVIIKPATFILPGG